MTTGVSVPHKSWSWVPAFAGTTKWIGIRNDPKFRRRKIARPRLCRRRARPRQRPRAPGAPHTVKPGCTGKIPESPRVVDLARGDSPLLGGRIDVSGRTPAPVLVYGHRRHVISLTAVPTPGKPDGAPAARASEGYHLL